MDFDLIFKLILDKNYIQLKNELKSARIADIAEVLDTLDEKQTLLVFRLLPKEIAADVFSYLSTEKQQELSERINEKELEAILDDLFFDDKIDILEEMPANIVKKILRNCSEAERKLINQFLMYPENSAGSLMTIEFVDLKKEMLVSEALERIRKIAPDKETIYTCYVMDSQRHLEWSITLKDLVLSPLDQRVGDIPHKEPVFVSTYDDQEYIASLFKKYDLLSVPVVDNEHRLVGIITIDDIVDVIENETTEDIYKMAAINPTEEMYIHAGVLTLARKRITWLLVLMLSATFTGLIIRNFEHTLQSMVVLAAFIPMLMDAGGNAGSQASAIVIRSLVLGEITFNDILRVIWKEIRISFLVGITLGAFNFLRLYFLGRNTLALSATVSVTLLFTIIIAKVTGGILPILAKKLKLDPAIMASPMITTIVDALTLIIYFYIANLLIGIPA